MTIVSCDICGKRLEYNHYVVKVEFRDGEHPHSKSTMHKTADCCPECVRRIPDLSCNKEFDEVVAGM